MGLLFNLIYWVLGIVMAFTASATIGMSLCTLIALLKLPLRPANFKLFLGYGACALFGAFVFWLCLHFGGWLGDLGRDKKFNFSGNWILYGAVFPGIFSLSMVFPFLEVAMKQSSGIEVEQ